MAAMTVSYLLSMEKSLKSRLSQLKDLRTEVATRDIWGDKDKIKEPQYDVKKVDAMITSINKALFEIDQKIKESNARTKIKVDIDYNKLMSEIE